MLEPIITGSQRASFVKEYNDRQSPLVVWGSSGAEESAFWNLTSGKAEFVTTSGVPITAGFPITNKTLATRDAYIARWGEAPTVAAALPYDVVRFILPDAIQKQEPPILILSYPHWRKHTL